MVALLGIVFALVVTFASVEVDFGDDPLLRLQGFGRQAGPAPTTAECGSAFSNLGTPSGGGTLYQVARDRACHDASKRQAAVAFAAGTVLAVLGVAGVVGVDQLAARRPKSRPQKSRLPEEPLPIAEPSDATQ